MPNRNIVTVSASILTAWRDAFDVVAALRPQVAVALLIVVTMWSVRTWIMPPADWLDLWSYMAIYNVIHGFLVAPYVIAVHRFVILGETAAGYRISPVDPTLRRFFCWWLAVEALFLAPSLISGRLSGPIDVIVEVALLAVVVALSIRAILIFPAVAVGAPDMDWRRAIADTGGHVWRIVFIIVGAMLPLVIAVVIFAVAAATVLQIARSIPHAQPVDYSAFWVASSFVGEFLWLFAYKTLVAVIASRLYEQSAGRSLLLEKLGTVFS